MAVDLAQEANDRQQLAPMLAQVEQNLGVRQQAASADAGYWNAGQVNDERVTGMDLYIATGKQKHGQADADSEPAPER